MDNERAMNELINILIEIYAFFITHDFPVGTIEHYQGLNVYQRPMI